MYCDVRDLRDFYDRPLGQMVRRLLSHRIRARYRHVRGQTIVGLGYAAPYLSPFLTEAANIAALMPAAQGALVWPRQGPNLSALVDDEHLPLADNSVDLLLGIHCLEGAERTRPLLRDIWRVLKPEGRLLLIVPNRTSMWTRSDKTPFGHGRPFTRGQLEKLLTDSLFATEHWRNALHVPPIERRFVMRSATMFERVGARLTPGIGGVLIVEARKEVAAPIGGKRVFQEAERLVPVIRPALPKDQSAKDQSRNGNLTNGLGRSRETARK